MKYAFINNIKTEATKGAKGICQNCGSELIAKCGDVKIHHWAHKGSHNCDPWWENETEWHRAWKDNFPKDWQEKICRDEITAEKHIADVRTIHGLFIEFQLSYIDPQERVKRENFYKNMIWIVDGTRLKRDYLRFFEGEGSFRLTNKKGVFVVDSPEKCFPSAWIGSSVPVIFDFKGMDEIKYAYDLRYPLYCLYPKSNVHGFVLVRTSREKFIDGLISGDLHK